MNAIHAIDDYVDLLLSPAPAEATPPAPPAPEALPAPSPRPGPRAATPAGQPQPRPPEDPDGHLARWLRLRCGEQTYALELLKIREVILPSPLLPLRGVGHAVSGIMNLRGQVVPVLDLGLHFGGDQAETGAETRIVVIEDRNEVLGLRVSCVEDIVLIDESGIEDARCSQLAPVGDQRIQGIARPGGRVMLLLDAARLLATPLH